MSDFVLENLQILSLQYVRCFLSRNLCLRAVCPGLGMLPCSEAMLCLSGLQAGPAKDESGMLSECMIVWWSSWSVTSAGISCDYMHEFLCETPGTLY